jgi:hypothetical protein
MGLPTMRLERRKKLGKPSEGRFPTLDRVRDPGLPQDAERFVEEVRSDDPEPRRTYGSRNRSSKLVD